MLLTTHEIKKQNKTENKTLAHIADIHTGTVYGLSNINSEFY